MSTKLKQRLLQVKQCKPGEIINNRTGKERIDLILETTPMELQLLRHFRRNLAITKIIKRYYNYVKAIVH